MNGSARGCLIAVAILGTICGGVRHTEAGEGNVWAWGHNNCGQLGIGTDNGCASDVTHEASPVGVNGLTDIVSVEAGLTHSIALRSDGTVWSWGRNEFKVLGTGSRAILSNVPVQTGNIENAAAVAAAAEFSLALKTDGTVWGWGTNTSSFWPSRIRFPTRKSLSGSTGSAGLWPSPPPGTRPWPSETTGRCGAGGATAKDSLATNQTLRTVLSR